jgi:hypothetical protein
VKRRFTMELARSATEEYPKSKNVTNEARMHFSIIL